MESSCVGDTAVEGRLLSMGIDQWARTLQHFYDYSIASEIRNTKPFVWVCVYVCADVRCVLWSVGLFSDGVGFLKPLRLLKAARAQAQFRSSLLCYFSLDCCTIIANE
jgi:hypothetical protein